MKLQLSTLGILFLLIFSSIACTDKKPENESDSLLPPDTPVTSVLKGSFESKFIRYEKGRKFAGQTSESLVTTVWNDTVWQNDRVHKQIVLWTEEKRYDNLTYEVSDLIGGKGSIPSSRVRLRFPSYITGDTEALTCGEYTVRHSAQIADALSESTVKTLTESDPVKIWVTIDIPPETVPGEYSGTLTVKSDGEEQQIFTIKLLVVNHCLPPVSEWSFHLDLWQFPFQLASLCMKDGKPIQPFSDEYFTLVKPYYELLADAGQSAITTYIKDGAFDKGQTMVKWTRNGNDTWSFDYTDFDRFVEKMMTWGITRQIDCFSLVGWDTSIGYFDASGAKKTLGLKVGSDEYNTVWTVFLDSFRSHLKNKGWFDKAVLYMDEIKEEEMRAVVSLITNHDKEWKIGLAGSDVSSDIENVLYDYSSLLGHDPETRTPVSTFYTSCAQSFPNNFVTLQTNPAEMAWMAWYAKAKGFDGYLRWAYDYWTKTDPKNIQDRSNASGDFNMIYRSGNTYNSTPVSSIRFELLREGIQDYEKMRILSDNRINPAVQKFVSTSGNNAMKLVMEAEYLLKKLSTGQ